jgi:hypothetical protein
MDRSLTMLVHGLSKVGKSTLAVTAPYPRLYLDVEAASRFLSDSRSYWDPVREAPPVADGTWDTCVVNVREYDDVLKVYQWLQLGKHQFASLIIDSISELQVRAWTRSPDADRCRPSSGATSSGRWRVSCGTSGT